MSEFFTEKQKELVRALKRDELKRINILYGSVRSGKTWITLVLFALWVATLPKDKPFLMVGKTLTALKRNCLDLLQTIIGEENFSYSISSKMGVLFGHKVFLEGANDARSESKIRGMTLQGAYVDEITIIDRDFFAMLLSRLSEAGAKLFGSTNPDNPAHWLKTEYIDRADELDMLVRKFEIDDNTFLDPEYIRQIKAEYTGVFYERFIKGNFVIAEGLVYDFFEANITNEVPTCGEYYVSVDYGTMNPFSAGLWCVDATGHAVRIKEYYYDGRANRRQKTDEEYCDEVEALCKGYYINDFIVDPSASSFIAAMHKRGYSVRHAVNDVLDGIRITARFLKDGHIKIHRSCKDCIREFGLYRWDDKSPVDKPIKENDHCLSGDTIVNTADGDFPIRDLIGKSGRVWSYNIRTGKKELKPFWNVRKTQSNAKVYRITLQDGRSIRCTGEHSILTERGYVPAAKLTESDRVIDISD